EPAVRGAVSGEGEVSGGRGGAGVSEVRVADGAESAAGPAGRSVDPARAAFLEGRAAGGVVRPGGAEARRLEERRRGERAGADGDAGAGGRGPAGGTRMEGPAGRGDPTGGRCGVPGGDGGARERGRRDRGGDDHAAG